jgi:hypothetical protein
VIFYCTDFPSSVKPNIEVRARVDGYWIGNSGNRNDMGAIFSDSKILVCPQGDDSTTPDLDAKISVSGSAAGSGPTFHCGGSLQMHKWTEWKAFLVSYVCQKTRQGTTNWTNVKSPQSIDCGFCGGTYFHSTAVDCGDLGSGDWTVRAHTDGYWQDFADNKHNIPALNSGDQLDVSC